jgi:hypothetical protein
MSLYFDRDDGYSRNPGAKRTQTNHYSGSLNDGSLINKGRGPTRGNQDEPATRVGPPATKDAFRRPPTASVPETKIKNPDFINGGSQYRGLGGTKVDKPKNIDKINIEPKGSNGMGESQSTSPVALAKRGGNPDSRNYGPRSQY